jgi:hypothetical protein
MTMKEQIDIEKLRLPQQTQCVTQEQPSPRLPRHRLGKRFLKGPIPWNWLTMAAQQSGRALHVGIYLWHLAFMEDNRTVRLSTAHMLDLGVDRHAKARGLQALERAALVSVIRHTGRLPIVTILDVPALEEQNNEHAMEICGLGDHGKNITGSILRLTPAESSM